MRQTLGKGKIPAKGKTMKSKRMTAEEHRRRSLKRRDRRDLIVQAFDTTGSPDDLGLLEFPELCPRFLFIESNVGAAAHTQSHWFSGHPSKASAAQYWLKQEYIDDWEAVLLVDLDTGERFMPRLQITWIEMP
jgi:hypothetical protein